MSILGTANPSFKRNILLCFTTQREVLTSVTDDREVRPSVQHREGEYQRFQQQLQESEKQQDGLLELLQESERQKDGLRQHQQKLQQQLQAKYKECQQLQIQIQNMKSSHQKELQHVQTENQQLRKQLQATQSESKQHWKEVQGPAHQLEGVHQQLKQQLVANEASLQAPQVMQQTHHTEFWEVPRDDVTLNMQRILGTGAWGYVVEGKFQGQTMAVKCLHDLIREPASVTVIRTEISIMAQVRHPNLVLLIAAVIDEEDPLIITELLDFPLRRAYERNRLDTGEHCKLSIFRDVASALNYLHLHHHGPIIHRDVSSANVLLEPRPRGQWRAKLSDFGSAKLAREATTTGPGAAVYSAPEVRRDTGIRQSPKVRGAFRHIISFRMLCQRCTPINILLVLYNFSLLIISL